MPSGHAYNLFGPKFKANPYPVYAHLREHAPVYRRANAGGAGATCFVTRYAGVEAVLRDHRRFVKDIRNTMPPEEAARLSPQPRLLRLMSNHMLNLDAPDHTRLRRLVNKAFTARTVETMQARIARVASELLDRVHGRTIFDLIEAYAFPLPIIVIAELLGIPPQDRARFRAWSNALVTPTGDSERDTKKLAKSGRLMEDFVSYLERIFEERRRAPRDDLISSLLHAEEAGEMLSEEELYSMVLFLTVVGHETTVNLIGNGMLALLLHPDQWQRLRRERDLLPTAIEEMVRYDCPVERAPMRFAAEDAEIDGVWIRRGDLVSAVLGSANRDPAEFVEPDRFDISRTPNRHLGFGVGAHYCLGAALARLEGRIALDALLERLAAPRLACGVEELRWRTNPIMRGVRRLPLATVYS